MQSQLFRPKRLCRKRINNLLSQIVEVPVFFISAAMGYGKTMAVKDFLEKKKDVKTIWFHLGYEENDDVRIWKKFCASIICINYKLSKKLINYGFPKDNIGVHEVIDIIRREIKKETVLVVDDWYDRATIYIDSLIKVIVLGEIHNLHVVILSRNQPLENYLELEIKQKCIVLWQEDMEFTFDETAEFFEINNFKLTDKEQKALYKYTGGWALATYFAIIEYSSNNTFSNIPDATEIIKTKVYDKFDEETKQILLKLSLVNKFTLEQASYVTRNKRANDIIKELISNNCFIRYHEELKEYTIHSILRNVLKEELLSNNINANDVNEYCGDWYSEEFKDIQAIQYYYKAGNFQRILDLIERNNFIDIAGLDPKIIVSVFKELSMEEKINRPIVYLMYIFLYIIHGNLTIGSKLLYEVKEIYESSDNFENKNQILGEVAIIESFTIFNDFRNMNKYYKKAYELFNGGTSKIVNYKMPFTFGAPNILYRYHNKRGELKDLVDRFQNEIEYFIHISNGCGLGANYLINAEFHFETGDIYNAELFAYKALYKAKSKKQTSIIIASLFLLTRICIHRNSINEVRNNINILINEYENYSMPRVLNEAEIAIAYINGITGNLEDMLEVTEYEKKPNLQISIKVSDRFYFVSGLKMILKGSYEELEVHVEKMLVTFKCDNNVFGLLYAHIFDSIVKYNRYDMEDAKKALLEAIDIAQEDSIVMSFIELAPHIMNVLKELEKENLYAKSLLAECEKFNKIYKKNYSNFQKIELTPREIEVMRLVEEGYKQREISEKLNIALITTKKHIASVYHKLKVKNKTIAINILKEKGMI